jgi:O-antigen/teichoic acid export membrane protein
MASKSRSKETLRQLVGNSTLYTLGNGLRRSLSLITMPVFTRFLPPAGYGVLAVVGSVQSMLEVLYELGVAQSSTRLYYDAKDREDQRTLFGTLLIFSMIVTAAFSAIFLLAGDWLWNAVSEEIPFYPYVALTVGTVFLGNVGVLPRVLFRVKNQVPVFFRLTLVQSIVSAALSVGLVVLFGFGPLGPIFATFVVSAIFAGVYGYYLRGEVKAAFDASLLRQSMSFGLPEVPLRWGSWALKVADRLILQRLTSLAVVAVYSVGYSVGKMAFDLVGKGIHWAIVPFFYSTAKRESEADAKRIFAGVATYNVMVLAAMGLATVMYAREAIAILASQKYAEAETIVPLIVIASFLQESFYIPSKGLYLMKKTAYMPPMLLVPAALNIGLNFLLIPTLGMMGAAWATVIAYVVMITTTLIVSQRVYPIPYEWNRILKVLGVAVGLGILKDFLPEAGLVLGVAMKTGLLLSFPVVLYLVGFFEGHEITWIRGRVARLSHGFARG